MTDDGNQHSEINSQDRDKEKVLKLYPIRWYILALYVVCDFSIRLQYIIPNEIFKFYEVTDGELSWTYFVMMICLSLLGLPAASLMDRIIDTKVACVKLQSLRWIAIIGSTGAALGSLIKLFSATPGGFYVNMVGHTVLLISLVFMVSVPQKLSRTWFGEREVSLACCIGYFGLYLSMIAGYFLPSLLLSDHEDDEDSKEIGKKMFNMFIYFAFASSLVAVLVVFTFRDSPPLPITSEAQPQQEQPQNDFKTNLLEFIKCSKRILSQRRLLAFFVTTGINNGCFSGLRNLLSDNSSEYFLETGINAGRIDTTMILSGMAASIAYGIILDKTKKFKTVLMVVYCMSVVSMATFTILLFYCKTVWVIYVGAAFMGTFLCGFTAVSYDVATELTYPELEYIIVTIMNMMTLLFTYSTTHTFRYINTNHDSLWSNIGFVVTMFVGAACTLLIKFEFRRTETISNDKEVEVEAEELLHRGFTSLGNTLV